MSSSSQGPEANAGSALESAHTPGPWVVDPRHIRDVQSYDGHEISTAFASYQEGRPLNLGGSIPWDMDTAAANARLIAAAPELLDVARVFLAQYPGGINPGLDTARTLARAAIAKAVQS